MTEIVAAEEDLATAGRHAGTQGPTTRAVARRIRMLRNGRGWSAQKVSDMCGERGVLIDRSVLSGLENGNGRSRISVDELTVLAAVFEVEPAYLLTVPGSRAVPIATELVSLVEKLADTDVPDPEVVQQAWSQYRLLGLELEELQ